MNGHCFNFTVNMSARFSRGLVWFRRDLRAHDNPALHHALRECTQVHCIFVFDSEILDTLPRVDRRVRFIRDCVVELDAALRTLAHDPNAGLIVCHARAVDEVPRMANRLDVQAVYAGQDDEPKALERDARVRTALARDGRDLQLYKDTTVFARSEVLTQAGKPYTVFTPYKNAWLRRLEPALLEPWSALGAKGLLAPREGDLAAEAPSMQALGHEDGPESKMPIAPGTRGGRALWEEFLNRIDRYDDTRNFPGTKGPSYLGVHLRFGTLSVRELAREAHARMQNGSAGAATWLSEIIWREFYQQLMAHYPHVVERSFKPAYDAIDWESGTEAERRWEAWRTGRTGYPLVDAAIAQITQTGYMHNRLRMVVASFLVKDLGIDWRRGEAWFAVMLNDFELASNNGGWQWASSSGCDAQPWFRIFNPVTQSQKFDADGGFIRRYLPELARLGDKDIHAPWLVPDERLAAAGVVLGDTYPRPVVDHAKARERTLERYSVVKEQAEANG